MRWITFCILLYVATALQVAQFGVLSGTTARTYPQIEYLVLLCIFYCLFSDDRAAPLTAAWCGLIYDLIAMEPLGTYTIPLILIALGVNNMRLSVFRERFISQIVVTLLAIILFGFFAAIFSSLTYRIFSPEGSTSPPFGSRIGIHAANALYTCILAPVFFWLIFRLRPILGFNAHRRTR